jgi:hypothetical protein
MMQSNKEFLKEITQGTAFGVLVLGVFVMLIWSLNALIPETKSEEKARSEDRFTVVDTYGSCAVIRYTDDTSRWHYFLDCQNQHLQ